MPNGQVVEVEELVKVYPGGTKAVAGIDFAVAQGELVGFLGPNGAGKSTTMKILATLLKKTSGRVRVAGHDVDRDPTAIRRSIGFAMQEVGLDEVTPGREFLVNQGLLYGLPMKEAKKRADELLELVGLTSVGNRKVGTYSGGMRRRIDLVAALIHRPPLVFLDEPTSGLDPQSRLAIWEHLEKLNKDGVSMFLTTQIMEEADRLCPRIAIIDKGKIVAEGSPRGLKQEVGGDVITVNLAATDGRGAQVEQAVALAKERQYVLGVNASGNRLTITVKDGGAAVPDLLRLFNEHQVSVSDLAVSSPTLDDVFLKHTGRKIRAGEAGGDEANTSFRPFLGLAKK